MFFNEDESNGINAGGAGFSGKSSGKNGGKYLFIVAVITAVILAIGFIF